MQRSCGKGVTIAYTFAMPGIPIERLQLIALRKLASLGVAAHWDEASQALAGTLPLVGGSVVHPASHQKISGAAFRVLGHDHLAFTEAPLSALGPILFYDRERLAALEERVAAALKARLICLRELASRFRALRIQPTLDAERLLTCARVRTLDAAFELEGDADGVQVRHAHPDGQPAFDVRADFPRVRLEDFVSSAQLERFLSSSVAAMRAGAAPAPASAPAAPPVSAAALQRCDPPPGALTLQRLMERLGPGVFIAPGSPLELHQDFEYLGVRHRFSATWEKGERFKAHLRAHGPDDKWSDAVDLGRIPGAEAVVATVLGASPSSAASAPAAPALPDAPHAPSATGAAVDIPAHLMPHPGEVWLMHVLIQEETEVEVRYVSLNADGQPFGAARLLKRGDFDAVFSREHHGCSLRVLIDSVTGAGVTYRQLDASRNPRSAPKTIPLSVLATNFTPDAG